MALQAISQTDFTSDFFVFDLPGASLTKCCSFAKAIIISLLDFLFDRFSFKIFNAMLFFVNSYEKKYSISILFSFLSLILEISVELHVIIFQSH